MKRFPSRSRLTIVNVLKIIWYSKLNALDFCVGLATSGYSQVPEVNFQEIYASVINDESFFILTVIIVTWNLKGKIVDNKTVLLYGNH
jgi:hypothetical protein